MLKTTLVGVAFACLSTSLGGMTVALTRLIIHQSEPLSLVFLRYGVGMLVLMGVMLASTRLPRIPARDLLVLAVLGVVMFSGFPYLMARALEDTTSGRAALIFSMLPLTTMVLGALFRVERLTVMKSLAIGVAIAGTMVALGEGVGDVAPQALVGDVLMFGGVVCASSYNVLSKGYLIRHGVLPVLVYTMLVGILVLFALALQFERPLSGSLDFDATGWFVMFLLAVPGGAVMMFSWSRALQLISPTQTAITIGFNPLTAILLGAWLLDEPITLRILGGFVLIVAAVVLANYQPGRKMLGR